ncbi:MAG: hypothetical protein FIB04_08705 [Gammaproteobacteria bacterium]|nr:hypothetical protein [Gammaproteobacteria bacterium]
MTENWERFHRATQVLVGPGPVKQRLCDAYLTHLRAVDAEELPLELQPGFAALAEALTSAKAAGGLGAIEATVRKMSEQDAGRHAGSVLDMFVVLTRGGGRDAGTSAAAQRQLRLVAEDDEIPAFLNRA